MRNYEDGYFDGENEFFNDFSVRPTASYAPAAQQFAVMPQQAAPQVAALPTAASPAFSDEDDYTGRMGPDGEPERYSTMRGGDPRVRQQQELADRERRLQEPFSIDNWLKSAGKDVRGTTAASQITLNPGTQYRIRDYSGGNDGQIIASGSTPEEFLMMQDIARGLARQGTRADYRLEQVGGEAGENFGQYRDPATGEVVSLIGGDLYNKPIAGDIIKIALPLALNVIPGLGLGAALGGKLGLSGLAAKAAGVGLTSALGRTGAGVLTGENVGDALKAGAVSGLASGATAGLLGATGADKAIGSALGGAKGAVAGEAAAQGAGQAAASLPGEIVVSAARNALAPSLVGGLSAAGGSLLGEIGQSLAQPDQFQQALEQARMQNQFAPTAPPMAPEDILEVVGQRGTAAAPAAGALAGAAPPLLETTLNDIIRQYEAPQQMAETPAEDEIVVSNTATPDVDLSGLTSLSGAGSPLLETTLNDIVRQYETPSEVPGETMLESVGQRLPNTQVSDALSGGIANIINGAESLGRMPETIEEEATVTGRRYDDPSLGAPLPVPAGALPTNVDYSVFSSDEPMLESSPDRLQREDFSAPLYVPPMNTLPTFAAPFTGLDIPAPVDSYPEQTVSQQRPQDVRGTLTAPITLPDGTLDFGEVVPEEASTARREDNIPPFTLDVPPFNPGIIPPMTVPQIEAPVEAPAEEEQVVSARRPDVVPPLSAGIAVPPLIIPPFAPPQTVPSGGGTAGTVKKVLTGLSLLDILSGALGGGGGGGGGGTPVSAASRLNPIFSAKLPSRSNAVPSDLGPRDMSGVDWKRYGFGPEKSFFNYVPANEEERRAMIAPAQPDTQLAKGGALAVKKSGSTSGAGSFAVKGPGTGRSDEIPALLSDGEYVIDAETVAMLGDGSSEAGAERLDSFRVNIRKHKGRNLAKGKFSANARAPERYLSGGRV